MAKIMHTEIIAPDGLYGLAVEPWTPGEIYAVAADWGNASCAVLAYGEMGWAGTGKQVADYSHDMTAALREQIEDAGNHSGGITDAEIDDIMVDAVEI